MKTRDKKITIYDIAKEVGVSASLVSRVLTGKGSVSEKNRIRIQEVIDKYQFRPNALARSLLKKRTKMVGFVLPHIGNEYFSSVYYEFEKRATENGYVTILFNGKSDPVVERKILKTLEETRVESIIFMGGRADLVGLEDYYVEELRNLNKKIPCIICSSRADVFGCIGIHTNDIIGVNKLIAHIAEQGYKSIGILGGTDQSYPSLNKRRYFVETAKMYGIEVRKEWIIGNSFNATDGYESMKKLLLLDNLPEVACCINDHVAAGVISAAYDAGLHIPQDIAVTGYDGVEASRLSRPPVTTVYLNYSLYGQIIFEAMQKLLEGGAYRQLSLIEPELIVRQSSIKPNVSKLY